MNENNFNPHIEEEEISLSELFEIVKPNLVYIILFSIILGLGSFLVTKLASEPIYQSEATMLGNNRRDDASGNITSDEINSARNLASVYSIIIKSDAVMIPVLDSLNLDMLPSQLASKVSVSAVDNTQVMRVSVKDTEPELAQLINQEILNVAPDIIVDMVEAGSARIVSYPQIPVNPISPNLKMNVLVATMLGFMLSTGFVFVRHLMDKTFRTEKDIENQLGIPVIGVIPNVQSVKKGGK